MWEKPSGAEDVVVEMPSDCNPERIPPVSKESEDMLMDFFRDVYTDGVEYQGDELAEEALVLHLKKHITRIERYYKRLTSNEGPFTIHEYVCGVWYLGKRFSNFPKAPLRFDIMLMDGVEKIIHNVVTRHCIFAELLKKPAVMENAKEYTSVMEEVVGKSAVRHRPLDSDGLNPRFWTDGEDIIFLKRPRTDTD